MELPVGVVLALSTAMAGMVVLLVVVVLTLVEVALAVMGEPVPVRAEQVAAEYLMEVQQPHRLLLAEEAERQVMAQTALLHPLLVVLVGLALALPGELVEYIPLSGQEMEVQVADLQTE